MPSKTQVRPYPLRLSGDLQDWLQTEAARNSRSLNKEMEHRLGKSREQQETLAGSAQGEAPAVGPAEASVNPPQRQS